MTHLPVDDVASVGVMLRQCAQVPDEAHDLQACTVKILLKHICAVTPCQAHIQTSGHVELT